MKSRAIHTFITLFLVVSLLLPVIAEKDTQQETRTDHQRDSRLPRDKT